MCLKVIVADDHALTLEGVVRALDCAHDIEVVGTANAGSEVMSLIKSAKPDVALLDYHMPGLDGLACLELIRRHHPHVKVVIVSAFDDRQHIETALGRGATAYVTKGVDPGDLPAALRQVCKGKVFHPFRAPESKETTGGASQLTARERTFISALARGLSNKAISQELWVTEQTVKFHLNNVYRKLGVENRAAAVRWAFENGVVNGEPQLA